MFTQPLTSTAANRVSVTVKLPWGIDTIGWLFVAFVVGITAIAAIAAYVSLSQ